MTLNAVALLYVSNCNLMQRLLLHNDLCIHFIDRPLRDRLNGAISGAVARNLDRELDYLIPRMYLYHYCS